MQQKIKQALADSPLSNMILSALEEQEWKGFLPAEKVRSFVMNLCLRLFN